jgi:HPt (histidine-containing phosphotransfer) domain-containing protein
MSAPLPQTELLYSRLAANEGVADLVELFVEELPGRVAKMRAHLATENWSELERCAHQMKGAAGSYGFDPLTPAATRLERAVATHDPCEQIAAALDDLTSLCQRVRAGTA